MGLLPCLKLETYLSILLAPVLGPDPSNSYSHEWSLCMGCLIPFKGERTAHRSTSIYRAVPGGAGPGVEVMDSSLQGPTVPANRTGLRGAPNP